MELGSAEHKQLLIKSIVRISLKVASLGFILGFVLMLPYLFRDNTFSMGLFYIGLGIILGSVFYALLLGYKKYQRLVKPFATEYSQGNEK